MNKKLIIGLIAFLSLTSVAAQAAPTIQNKSITNPTIAVLDTALDTSLPIFKNKIIFEACVTEWSSCPNGKSVMEGPGSATLPKQFLSANGFDHGTQMTSIALAVNPNINIVFVRIIGNGPTGLRQASGEPTVYNALDWVIANKDRFNIQAVTMSQGFHPTSTSADYCPKTPNTEAKVQTLANANIPVFFPAGNARDYVRVDWPGCIKSAITIGATMPTNEIAIYTNHDKNITDFFALGTYRATTVGGTQVNVAGTSASTITAAVQWATIKNLKPTLTYSQVYDLISKTSTPTSNSKITGGKLINMNGAING